MDALNNEALLKARSMISTTFVSPASLDELSALSIQFERQLHAAEGQLNSAVQGKLDSLKRAVDLMDESAVKLSTMSTKISKIDERIALTNTAISNYDNLSRIHNARENLQSVIAQIDFFAKVPERVNYYRQLLNSSPGKLREVYLEALKLDSLRNALMKEILVSRTRRKAAGKDKYSEESHRRMKMAVENYLSRVTDLVAEVRERVFENIDQMWELAVQSPEDLVSSIEIIEMQQEYNDRREAHAKKKATEEGVSYSRQHEDVRGKALELIQSNFEQLIATEYDKLLEEHEEVANRTKVQHALEVTNQLLQSLASIRKDVAPCMPDNYNLTAIFVSCFEQRLKPLIDDLVQDLPAMKVSDILELINWIEFYKFTMEDFGFAQRNILDDFSVLKVDLLIEYMNKIKQQVTSWFVNIKKQSLEIVQDSDGLLVTSNPEDMFNIIHAQLSVAKEKLPPEYAKEVAVACLQVLQDVQRENHDTLTNNWKSMDPETMCATVNDNQRMREKCVEFGEDLLKYVEDEQEKVMLSASLEAVSKEYHALANRIVSYLGRYVGILNQYLIIR